MGWEDYHLYNFKINRINIGLLDEDNDELEDAEKIKLSDYLVIKKQKFYYTYDFGDSWEHILIIENILDSNIMSIPICLAGEKACPPEDCGGMGGYEELLKIRLNKNHKDYEKQIIDWLGEKFDLDSFNLEKINKKLSKLK